MCNMAAGACSSGQGLVIVARGLCAIWRQGLVVVVKGL